ncbi:recombination mediator RecR [Campylobacter sp. CX2-8023-23]|uniref:recombination mediator RecR n=1 Tax=Campylobacter porcelli TaxID=1660073 RepID=UPI002EB7AFC3|nr:recombination mediator RecR [Campylobacter sp. CX2-8023-23]MEE3776027.1 recombination mediator RecR [Campylobacter sp. CX2-4080-23]
MVKNLDQFDNLVEAFGKIPGVGKKSAIKYAYYIALQDPFFGLNLAHTIENSIHNLKHCVICGGISQNEICDICANSSRDSSLICVVESPKDILTIEDSHSFDGLYFVFSDIQSVEKLKDMIIKFSSKELIFAFSPSINSDGIMLYIEDQLKDININFTKIAQGIPTGVSLENVDMLSLTKAIKDRKEL